MNDQRAPEANDPAEQFPAAGDGRPADELESLQAQFDESEAEKQTLVDTIVAGELRIKELEEELKSAKASKAKQAIPLEIQKALRVYATPTRRSNARLAQGIVAKYEIPRNV